MTADSHPVVVIACNVFQGLLERFLPQDVADRVNFLEYGLHEYPALLNEAVQERIDSVEEPSRILLGYGLCGNGLDGVRAGPHTLFIPRADDCIAILLGSYEAYQKEFSKNPGTYYLTKGWLESGSDPLREYNRYVEKYGAEKAAWVMDEQYRHYDRLVLVAHSQEDLDTYRPRALEVAEYCKRWDMDYEEVLGSESYVRELVNAVATQSISDEQFLVIPPGGSIEQSQFLRMRG